jgi:2-phosphoglycerate kinase
VLISWYNEPAIIGTLAAAVITFVGSIIGGRMAREQLLLTEFWRWRRKLPSGFVLVVNGGSGVGKSTVAWALARRFNVLSVVSSDVVREGFRGIESYPADATVRDLIAHSSYQAHGRSKCEDTPEFEEECIATFKAQTSFLMEPILKIAHRVQKKNRDSIIIEGVNISGSTFLREFSQTKYEKIFFVNLHLDDTERHEKRLRRRGEEEHDGRVEDYIRNIIAVRHIDRWLKKDAEPFATTESAVSIENSSSLRKAVRHIESKLNDKLSLLRKLRTA